MRKLLPVLLATATLALAHTVTGRDADFVRNSTGTHIAPFLYLGAKHMVTGYDHLLFLVGVIFFLYKLKDVAIYVTCFAVGHSVTLLAGVLGGIHVNPYIVDALIGLSVVYKAFDNLDGFRTLFGFQINTKAAVLGFGLIHGFGLATKLQEFNLPGAGTSAKDDSKWLPFSFFTLIFGQPTKVEFHLSFVFWPEASLLQLYSDQSLELPIIEE